MDEGGRLSECADAPASTVSVDASSVRTADEGIVNRADGLLVLCKREAVGRQL